MFQSLEWAKGIIDYVAPNFGNETEEGVITQAAEDFIHSRNEMAYALAAALGGTERVR